MKTPFAYVTRNGLAGLREELRGGIDPNVRDDEGRTLLINAAIDNRLQIAEVLLQAGATTDAQDRIGYTALHYASQDYHSEMVSPLLRHDAPVDVADVYGNTPLWRALFNAQGREEIIAILLKAGADPHLKNNSGKSPVDLAKSIANYDLLSFLT